jgi:lipoprotein-releasing system ATP-binding protein
MLDSNLPLEIKNITKFYQQGDQKIEIIKDTSYVLEKGLITGLVGPSGSGKSTLLKIIGLLEKPNAGEIIIKGVNVNKASEKLLTKIRGKHIGFIYQFHHLLPEFNIIENVAMQELINGASKEEAFVRAENILKALKLGERLKHFPNQLSGGEQQRAAIARAIIKNPTLLLADEPTGNLDPYNAENVFEIFVSLVRELKLSALIATHNEQLMLKMDKIITLKEGRIVQL